VHFRAEGHGIAANIELHAPKQCGALGKIPLEAQAQEVGLRRLELHLRIHTWDQFGGAGHRPLATLIATMLVNRCELEVA
jgi:hypothetical protein